MGIHGLIYNSDGMVLLIKRSSTDIHEPNCWDLPGGGVNVGETVESTLKRETLEETGLNITDSKIIVAYCLEDKELQLIAKAQTKTGGVKISYEHDDFRWVTQKELMEVKTASIHVRAVQKFFAKGNPVIEYRELV